MAERNQSPFPIHLVTPDNYLKLAWEKGLLNDYAEEHFLIKAIENRMDSIESERQLLLNNSRSIYSPINLDGEINYSNFSLNFVLNLSQRLKKMSDVFGEQKIQKFVKDQLAAGKENYNADSFFQALSEVEILEFYCNRCKWDQATYEPPLGPNGSNPEASFVLYPAEERNFMQNGFTFNIEVKTPGFPVFERTSERRAIPTILLNDDGRKQFVELCKRNQIKCILPRVTKLVSFLNSAAKKFNIPKENEFNLLYINWSYSDFPSNGFLEAWSLLTNEINGILNHPEIGMNLPLREPVHNDVYRKISGIVVYTSSIDQLMISDFRYSWQGSLGVGPRFRMILNNSVFNGNINIEQSGALFNGTGMNPDPPIGNKWKMLFERNWTKETLPDYRAKDRQFQEDASKILNHCNLHS